MPRYYGIFLDVKDRQGLVFGGDAHEGQRKVEYLRECGASVRLFSPEELTSPKLQELAASGEIEWVKRRYQPGDVKGGWIVIVADTSDSAINEAISAEAKEHNVLLNVMDVTPLCTFIAPALIHRNAVTVAVSTSGSSPALARRLREEMTADTCNCLRWANVGPILADSRKNIRGRGLVMCPEKWQTFMTPSWLDEAEHGDPARAQDELIAGLESVACKSCAPFGSCQRIETPAPH